MWSPQSAVSGCGGVMWSPQSAASGCGSVIWSPQSAASGCGSVMCSPQSAADDIGSVVWSPQSAANGLRRRCVVTTNSCRRIAAALCGRNIPSAAVAVIIPFKLPWFNISLFLVLYTLYIYTRVRVRAGAWACREASSDPDRCLRRCPRQHCPANTPCRRWRP